MNEDNKAVDRRYVEEVLNAGRLEVIDEICAPEFVSHVAGYPEMGREGDKQLIAMLRAAFPDFSATIEDQIAEEDRVVHRLRAQGTHQGEIFGVPPTGKRVEVSGININRFVDGKLVEAWGIIDVLGVLVQIGAMPAPV